MKKMVILLFIIAVILVILTSCEDKQKNERARRNQELIMEMATPVEKRTEVCSVCRGTGKTKCKDCRGSGTDKDVLNRPVDCYKCDGYGFFVCNKCGGTGVVTVLREK